MATASSAVGDRLDDFADPLDEDEAPATTIACGVRIMAEVTITKQKEGFWVTRTGDGEAGAGESLRSSSESGLVSVLQRWGFTKKAIDGILAELKKLKNDESVLRLPASWSE
jgi:hypothetical protein